jgi:hypothetical protein
MQLATVLQAQHFLSMRGTLRNKNSLVHDFCPVCKWGVSLHWVSCHTAERNVPFASETRTACTTNYGTAGDALSSCQCSLFGRNLLLLVILWPGHGASFQGVQRETRSWQAAAMCAGKSWSADISYSKPQRDSLSPLNPYALNWT